MPAAVCIDLSSLPVGEHRVACPACGEETPRKRNLGVTVDADGWLAHCYRCGFVERVRSERYLRREGRPPPIQKTATRFERLSDAGIAVWQSTRALEDDASPAAVYLRDMRGCPIPCHACLRWKAAHAHPCGYVGPVLVGLVTDVLTFEALTLHVTWLTSAGKKAPIESPRLLLPGHRKQGGVIELSPREHFIGLVGIAEGIESALSLAYAGMPNIWCAIDAGNLAALPVVPGTSQILIAADGDAPGRRAAEQLAARYRAAGRGVRVLHSPDGHDANDPDMENFP